MTKISAVLCVALLGLWTSVAGAATSLNGIWSNSAGGYLVMLEASSGGTVVVLQIEPEVVTGKIYLGSRSGELVSVTAIDTPTALAFTVSGNTYTGSRTLNGTTATVGGQLLFAYVGGSYDGIWQRTGTSDRYLALITATINQASAVVLVDMKLSGSGVPTYDLVLGAMSSAGFAGKSMISNNAVTMSFVSGNPTTANYTALSVAIPPKQLETFGLTQLIGTASPTSAAFTLSSGSFTDGALIPLQHACTEQAGSNISPALAWSNAPSGTAAYAIVMDDEVSPCGTGSNACIHWNAFNLPAATSSLGAGVNPTTLGATVVLGTAYNGMTGYQGPCPPSPHIYKLTLYALDSTTNFVRTPALTRSQFASTYAARILGSATLTGNFGQ